MKKVTAIFTLISFLIYITSCYSYKNLYTEKEYIKYSGNKMVDILYVLTKQGNTIEFNEKVPGRITEKGVVGLPLLRLPFVQDSIVVYEEKIQSIWKNGIKYEVITQDNQGYICHAPDTIHIPLSDIEKLEFRKFNKGKTVGLICGIAGGAIAIVAVIAFINGMDALFDELFGTSD
jgi:hypothetical protein